MKTVYLDYNSTVPVDNAHLKLVVDLVSESDGNPSNLHYLGRKAKALLEKSRRHIAELIGSQVQRVIFNSGASEGNNHVLHAFLESLDSDEVPSYIVSEGEHSALYQTALSLSKRNLINLELVPLTSIGSVNEVFLMSTLKKAINARRPVLVSLIHVNNETGVENPIFRIGEELRKLASSCPEVPFHFHVDAAQALGKVDTRTVVEIADTAVFSGHKIGALKGSGVLYVRKGVRLPALILGGGQERGFRSGTENLIGAVSFGVRAKEMMGDPFAMLPKDGLFKMFLDEVSEIDGLVVHGDSEHNCGSTVNFHVEGKSIERLNLALDLAGIAVSNGSACSSGLPVASRVLLAMGYSEEAAKNSIRVSFNARTTKKEIDYFVQVLKGCLTQ